jgi:hypothetical protein
MLKAEQVYYLKLGRGGEWADDSMAHGRARIGWKSTPLAQINAGEWSAIKKALQATSKTMGAGTMDANALERCCRSTDADVWVTFHDSKLWWGRLKNGPIKEDATSKYREVLDGWRDSSLKNDPLLANQIPGRISQLQGFRATICRVRDRDALLTLLSGERSTEFLALAESKNALIVKTAHAIKTLHWRDFELLVDLVFRQSGWRRVSAVGEKMKSVDIELEDPITGDQYQVQVKSRATKEVASKCKEEISASAFRKYYLVVHTADPELLGATDLNDDEFEVILTERLAGMVVDGGLTGWLLDKIL